MKRLALLLFLCLASQCFVLNAQEAKKKSVFIIVDGIPADVIERVNTPAIDAIAAKGGYTRAYMGGEANGLTKTPTISAVGYNCLLTATWANKHNVWGNDISAPNYNYWNIFRIAETQKKKVKTAVFSSWQDNRTKLIGEGKIDAGNIRLDYALDGLDLDKKAYPNEKDDLHVFKIDEAISTAAAVCIKEEGPDVMWVYLWYTDDAGHIYGNGEFLDKYTALADKQVARVWDAVKAREKKYKEKWMVVVTTDHGRSDNGKGHGGHSERERTTWISTNVKPNAYFAKNQPGIVDIVPSICRYMGFSIPADVQYEQEGVPFIGKINVSNPTGKKEGNTINLTWESHEKAPVDIYLATTNNYKTGTPDEWKKVGTVASQEKKFTYEIPALPEGQTAPELYKFSLRSKDNMAPVWVK